MITLLVPETKYLQAELRTQVESDSDLNIWICIHTEIHKKRCHVIIDNDIKSESKL